MQKTTFFVIAFSFTALTSTPSSADTPFPVPQGTPSNYTMPVCSTVLSPTGLPPYTWLTCDSYYCNQDSKIYHPIAEPSVNACAQNNGCNSCDRQDFSKLLTNSIGSGTFYFCRDRPNTIQPYKLYQINIYCTPWYQFNPGYPNTAAKQESSHFCNNTINDHWYTPYTQSRTCFSFAQEVASATVNSNNELSSLVMGSVVPSYIPVLRTVDWSNYNTAAMGSNFPGGCHYSPSPTPSSPTSWTPSFAGAFSCSGGGSTTGTPPPTPTPTPIPSSTPLFTPIPPTTPHPPLPTATPIPTPTTTPTLTPVPTATSTPIPIPTMTPTPTPACTMPKEDDGSGNCVFVPNHHRCDDGSISGLASPVSKKVTGSTRDQQFNNAMNKKLACCLNSFVTNDPYTKFDCIENAKTQFADFNALWSSSDDSGDGGQINAIVLANSVGKPLSGFYTLSGTRCAEFSEFAGDLQPAKVNPTVTVGSMNYANHKTGPNEVQTSGMGTPYPVPSSAAYTFLKSKFQAQGKTVPTTAAERRRCPILVRAAAQYLCGSNPLPPGSKKSYQSGTKTHCPVASSIQVHIRIEQLTEIAGMPKFKTEDTVTHPRNASAISLERIIAEKYGNQCAPGSHLSGSACVNN